MPVTPSIVAGPDAVHNASLRLGKKEKEKLKQVAADASILTASVALHRKM